MTCHYHPERSDVAYCVTCGKSLCSECIHEKDDQIYCKDCFSKIVYPVEFRDAVFPALICGIFAGFISAAPVLSVANCIFCLWIVIGGGIAVYIVKNISKIKGRISTEMAALTGGITGLTAAIVMLLAQLLLLDTYGFALKDTMMPSMYEIGLGDLTYASVLGLMIVVAVVVFTIFGAIGGVISNQLTK